VNFQFGLVWSPDGKRLAVLNQENVQIWDAATGGHLLTIPASGELPVNDHLAWAPNGQWLAIVNNSAILIVNAQTGAIIHQFPNSFLAESQPVSLGPYLSALFPVSGGGVNISGLVWSPDSHFLAVTTASNIASARHFFILNAQTGTVVHHFPETASNWITVASWSSDGTYLAAVVMNAGSQSEEEMAWVWNLSTYQVVFQQKLGTFSPGVILLGNELVWQPHSDNLALAEGVRAGQDSSSIALWDVAHHRLIKSYTQANTNLLTWSPDGKYLALVVQAMHVDLSKRPAQVTTKQEVVALDVQSGQRTVVFQQTNSYIAVLAWSPNGKYIATGPEGWPAPIQVLSAPV
jgi:WD40 repeat protein